MVTFAKAVSLKQKTFPNLQVCLAALFQRLNALLCSRHLDRPEPILPSGSLQVSDWAGGWYTDWCILLLRKEFFYVGGWFMQQHWYPGISTVSTNEIKHSTDNILALCSPPNQTFFSFFTWKGLKVLYFLFLFNTRKFFSIFGSALISGVFQMWIYIFHIFIYI